MDKEKTQGFCLKNKSVCVIGCGGLGCNVAVHLAGSGIGKLVLCDFDTVSESNLNRQFFYTRQDIGKSKVQRATEFLSGYCPESEIVPAESRITDVSDLSFAKGCDLIISAVDNGNTRRILGDFCRKENIPLVLGTIDGFYGMAYLYVPYKSPCEKCASMSENVSVGKSVSSTAGIIGAHQAHLAIQYLLTKDEKEAGNLLVFDDGEFHTLKIKPSQECAAEL